MVLEVTAVSHVSAKLRSMLLIEGLERMVPIFIDHLTLVLPYSIPTIEPLASSLSQFSL